MAKSTLGSSAMWRQPATARVANQTSMIGPKNVATRPVPRLWTTNRATRIASVIGTT